MSEMGEILPAEDAADVPMAGRNYRLLADIPVRLSVEVGIDRAEARRADGPQRRQHRRARPAEPRAARHHGQRHPDRQGRGGDRQRPLRHPRRSKSSPPTRGWLAPASSAVKMTEYFLRLLFLSRWSAGLAFGALWLWRKAQPGMAVGTARAAGQGGRRGAAGHHRPPRRGRVRRQAHPARRLPHRHQPPRRERDRLRPASMAELAFPLSKRALLQDRGSAFGFMAFVVLLGFSGDLAFAQPARPAQVSAAQAPAAQAPAPRPRRRARRPPPAASRARSTARSRRSRATAARCRCRCRSSS